MTVPHNVRVTFRWLLLCAIPASCRFACNAPPSEAAGSVCSGQPRLDVVEEVCVTGGTFLRGHAALLQPDAQPDARYVAMPWNDWAPARATTLRPFWIDAVEVSWRRYAACVDAGICTTTGIERNPTTRRAFREPAHAERPASGLTYDDASALCLFEGKRLPTEAEWELAARGLESFDYPWGNEAPRTPLLAAPTTYPLAPHRVDRYPPVVGSNYEDVSPFGVHDMFASVPEWVADWYTDTAYEQADVINPVGPRTPVHNAHPHEYGGGTWVGGAGGRVVRGDRWSTAGGRGWDRGRLGAPLWFRNQRSPDDAAGARCARDGRKDPAPEPGVIRHFDWKPIPAAGSP